MTNVWYLRWAITWLILKERCFFNQFFFILIFSFSLSLSLVQHIAKLAVLAIKQISKPLANAIKNRAKKSPFFRHYVCMPPAQIYHYFDVNVKMKLMNVSKPREVVKLNEAMAIDLGAELLGEFVIFFVASATLTGKFVLSICSICF